VRENVRTLQRFHLYLEKFSAAFIEIKNSLDKIGFLSAIEKQFGGIKAVQVKEKNLKLFKGSALRCVEVEKY
jgi:hypothetical protein